MPLTFVPKHRKRERLFLDLFGNPTRPDFRSACLNFYRVHIANRTVEQAIKAADATAAEADGEGFEMAKEAAGHFRNALLARV